MSRGKKFVALSLMTFIVIVVLGAIWGHKGGDPTGATSTVANSYSNVFQGGSTAGIPVSQVGINQLATSTGNAGLSVNFVWVLITGFLVLFMQVGFAFLVTGLTRAKNAAHVAAKVLAHTAIATLAFWLVGFAIKAFLWPVCYFVTQAGTGTPLARVADEITGYVGWAGASTSWVPWHFAARPDASDAQIPVLRYIAEHAHA